MYTLFVGEAKSNITNDTSKTSPIGSVLSGGTCVQPSEDSASVSRDESGSEVITGKLLLPCPQSSNNVVPTTASAHDCCRPVTPEFELMSKVQTRRVNQSTDGLLNTTHSVVAADVS